MSTSHMLDELGRIEREVESAWNARISDYCRPLPRKSKAGAPRQYELQQVFCAILALVRFAHPLRRPLLDSMPGVHPTFQYIHFWSERGCLPRMWRAYLHTLTTARMEEWDAAFRSPKLVGTARQNAFWFIEMKKVLLRMLGQRQGTPRRLPGEWRARW